MAIDFTAGTGNLFNRLGRLFGAIEDLAKIDERGRLGISLRRAGKPPLVDIAQGDDILGGDTSQVRSTAASRRNDGDVQLAVEVLASQHRGNAQRAGGRDGHRPVELAPRHSSARFLGKSF